MSTFWTILSNWFLQAYKLRLVPELIVSLILATPLSVAVYILLGPDRLVSIIPALKLFPVKVIAAFVFTLFVTSFLRSVLMAVFFRKPLVALRKQMASRHLVSGKFMITLIQDVINGHSNLIAKLQGSNSDVSIADVGMRLETDGIALPNILFPQLLAVSASLYPVDLRGLWNTCWYNPEAVFEASPIYSGELRPNKDWRKYFEVLGSIYTSRFPQVRNRHRIFVVDDERYPQIMNPEFFDDCPHWKQLLMYQRDWGIDKQVFVAEADFNDIIEGYEGFCRDLVIFRRRFHRRGWIIGQRKKNGIVRLISIEDQFKEYMEKYNRIESASHHIVAILKSESVVDIVIKGPGSDTEYSIHL